MTSLRLCARSHSGSCLAYAKAVPRNVHSACHWQRDRWTTRANASLRASVDDASQRTVKLACICVWIRARRWP